MYVSLLDFLKSGHFGNAKLGMTRQEVVSILGEPTHIWDRKLASHWSYGSISFFFPPKDKPDNGLYWVHCDQIFSPLYSGDGFALDQSFVTEQLTLTDAEKLFNEQHIAYEKCECDVGGGEITYRITLESGVRLYFHLNYLHLEIPYTFYLKIFSIQRKVYNPIPYEEQLTSVTIDIPQYVYNILRKISTHRKVSVRNLTSELLTQSISNLPETDSSEDNKQ